MSDMRLVGFLWSPAKHLWDFILSEIGREYEIEKYYTYDFGKHKEQLEECVIDIYKADDISIDKVKNVKLESMRRFSNQFLMFYIKIDDPEYRKKGETGNNISKVVERIKKKIRGNYQDKIDGYIHDIILHIADNDTQTREIEMSIMPYQKFRKDEQPRHCLFMNLRTFLKHQLIRGEFNRVDVLVRAYSAKCYLEDENYDFALYITMQKNRSEHQGVSRFKDLIGSFERIGFDPRQPIPCAPSYRLLNGSHRLAIAYFNKHKMIPIQVFKTNVQPRYAMEWFEDRFNADDIDVIKQEYEKLMRFIKDE